MKYALYEAKDTRDGRIMLWLHDTHNHQVATFCQKWAPSRIKHRTAASPDSIIWENDTIMIVHAEMTTSRHIDSWEFNIG